MIRVTLLIIGFILGGITPSYAQADRVAQLEEQVKDLSQRLAQIEDQLKQVKGGGFTVVPVTNCELSTPFDGKYTSSELSKAAAESAVIEKCKEKAINKGECSPSRVTCR